MDPTLLVLLCSSMCAGMAALGPLPLLGRKRVPAVAIGWANAVAAGLMLGTAYLLMAAGMEYAPIRSALGAVLGIGFVWFTHFTARTEELDLNRLGESGEVYGHQVLLANTLHSAPEGVAIGAAMGVSIPFGVFMAVVLAVHNVPEATVLSAILRGRGVRAAPAARLAVMTNLPQILLAVASFAVLTAAPHVLPWFIGFAVGALIYLVLAEQLPECYHQAGSTTIALVTLLAMGIVVLLEGVAR